MLKFITIVLLSICIFETKCEIDGRGIWYLGNENPNAYTRGRCIKKDSSSSCPDSSISFLLISHKHPQSEVNIDIANRVWLTSSGWDKDLETIILYHGYDGRPNKVPIAIARDAYVASKKFNVIMVDWSTLSVSPCYSMAIRNMDIVGRCTAKLIEQIQVSTNDTHKITCSGHSLGAHICGYAANYLTKPLYRIIGLDPAKPNIGNSSKEHLDLTDAISVQMIITNGGGYGVVGGYGHLDICINGGRLQPYCRVEQNEALCSHVWSVCYLAESLFKPKAALPCEKKCPSGRKSQLLPGESILIGDGAPNTAVGTYCVQDNSIPYCPNGNDNIGDVRCCMRKRRQPHEVLD